ncbi:MAG: hypothetical protein FWB89_08840 [Treponema sp.]|nr:hypothetical protein [Treponema sp.]
MKNQIFFAAVFALFILAASVSCKSAPRETPPPPAPSAPVFDSRAGEARKRAMDFDCHVYFPSDWEKIEERYIAAGGSQITDRTQSAGIAAEYDELLKKTAPLYAQAREDEIMFIRNELINSGFARVFPEYIKNADTIALTARDQYEAGNFYEAKNTAAKALSEYQAQLTGARVMIARQELIDRGLEQDEISKIDVIAMKAMKEYEAGNINEAVASAEEALFRYASFLLVVNR